MNNLRAQFKASFGRQWKEALMSQAQAIALAGCGKGKCLVNRELCSRCNALIIQHLLAIK